MSQPGDYTVGWICAIRTEYVAARAFLDEEHEGPATVSPNDNNAYTLGKIWGHNVVIAVLPDGEYGISSAASVARDMMHSFPNIRVGLMVGIGGGAPSKRHDIRLGDIVVSAPRDGKGGVYQYDFGKSIQDQSFKQTGFLNQPPAVLRTAVTVLGGRYESDGHELEGAISKILLKKKRLQKTYGRPDPSSDRLYQSKVVHLGDGDCCSAACGTAPSKMISRPARTEDEENPAIHYGIIASGNQLMKDASIRDMLAAEEDVLCFEMEAAGLMNHFPCLVIRGICDYSDSHKNKEWQGYAAMVAAAYAKDLLRRIAPSRIEAEKRIAEALSGLQQGVNEVIQVQHDQANKDILDWLTPIEYGPQHSDFLNRRQPGTGQWLLDCAEYQTWLDSDKCTLFCPGIPGSGKTILTAIVVNDVITRYRDDPTIGIAYIYLNFRQKDDQEVEKLLASLLKQLARSQSFPESVKDLHDRHRGKQTRPSANEMLETLQSVAAPYSKVFIIVDALDECQPFNECGKQFLSCIFNFQAGTATNLFATSRPIPDIEAQFKSPLLRRDILASSEDVRTYLDGHASDLPKCVVMRPDLQEEIEAEIASAVEGMFLLAQLYINSLKDKTSIKQIKSALEQFKRQRQLGPGEENQGKVLEQAYEQAMDRINNQMPGFQVLGKAVLAWITCAKRKLTTSELQHALAVEIGSTEFDPDNLPEIEDMVSACAGLVTIDEKSDIIRLVHYTAQEYFERTQQAWFPDAETSITETCVTYLSFSVFESGVCLHEHQFEERLRSNLLYDYAARNWGHHAGAASKSQLVRDFLESEAHVAASSQGLVGFGYMSDRKNWRRPMTGIHLAAFFGLTKITSRLLDKGHDANVKDGHRRSPLYWAACNGHKAMVRLLLDQPGADVGNKYRDGQSPLTRAALNGHRAIVKLLLKHGANIDGTDKFHQTPLLLLAKRGNQVPIVKLLLEKGAGTEEKDSLYGRTPLLWAAAEGHEAIVRLLLHKGVDIEAMDKYGQTPLSLAAQKGCEAVVRLLLERGADVEAKHAVSGLTPLWFAVKKGDAAVARVLLDGGADAKAEGGQGLQTLWEWAAEEGDEAIVELLHEYYEDD